MKKILIIALAIALAVGLGACGGETADEPNTDLQILTVGATPSPHAEMLEAVKGTLADAGIDLQIVEFTDYVVPNTALESGDLDANFFQHQPYLDSFNETRGTTLVAAGQIHFEPLGVYPGKTQSLDAIAEGAQIAVPNDVTNEARALQLLEQLGIFTLDPQAGLEATPLDIIDNPLNVKIIEMEAAAVPKALNDVDFAVVNGNYALGAEIIDTVLVTEDPQSEAALLYANIVAVKKEMVDDDRIKALVEALTSEEMKAFIEEKYGIVVQPVF